LQEVMMARAYSDDLRGRVIDMAISGASARASAARFGVGVSTAIVWIRRARQDAERSARRQGKPSGSRLDPHEAFIVEMIGASKDITLNEMAAKLRAERGLEIGRSALSAWLGGHGWTFKKSLPMRWSRNARIS
jgi:transposase